MQSWNFDRRAPSGGDSQAVVIASRGENRQLLVEALEDEGFHVVEIPVSSVRGSRFPDEPPALIVVDAGERTGDWCRRIRSRVRLEHVPLIALSEDEGRGSLHAIYEAGATAVFLKPVQPAFLRERFRSHGDTGRTLTGIQPALMADARILHAVPDIFFVLGVDGMVREYLGGGENDPLLRPERLTRRRLSEVLPRDVAALILRNIRRTLSTRDTCNFEFELGDNGEKQRYEMRLLVQGRDRVMAITRNVSEMQVGGRSGDGDSGSDTLTGLPGRAAFLGRFAAMIDDARRQHRGLAVMSVDLDRFTRINRTLGRPVGDAILRVVGSRLERCLRDADAVQRTDRHGATELARLGGDEFVIVLRDIEERDDVRQVANRVRDAFADPVSYQGHQIEVSTSTGIALFPEDGGNAEELLANVRAALDEARFRGSDRPEFYSDTVRHRALKRLDLKDELRTAIEQNQLELRYLPRIDLGTGRIGGLEALLRWQHPARGLVSLDQLIPLAEATGLMRPIGKWVLYTACAHAAYWSQTWESMPPISVNLSEQEFSREDLTGVVRGALERACLPAEQLELEVTEAVLMRERHAEITLQKLSALGVGLVIDDFGVGHSSLGRLTHYPLKAMKIDRSFVERCQDDTAERSVCSAAIAVARELGLTVIAEGVETLDQIEFLRDRGCDALQGFFFSEPLTADEVPAFLEVHLGITADGRTIDLATIRRRFTLRNTG
ncbi:MAG: EAL domain-containing protein [Gammaproteobacteria bacterium]